MIEQKTTNTARIGLNINYLPSINYSMMMSGVDTFSSLVIENTDDADWHDVQVTVSGQYLAESSCRIDQLPQGQSVQITSLTIQPDLKMLCEITEAVNTTFVLRITEATSLLLEAEFPIMLMAYDQWAGSAVMPEHIAAFVTPNNPLLARVKINAARFLEQWTGSAAFDEYQTQDRNRVRAQVAALFEALRSEGIVYSAPPASFEATGQRIRMADTVLTEKIGTCIDTSLLMASCLESVGTYPIILQLKGHAMVGAWLTPTVSPQVVCDDASYLLKEMADGINNLVLLESTLITSSSPVTFEQAVSSAMKKVTDESQFLYFVDIHRCRLANVRPIPQRVMKDGGWTLELEGVQHENATESVKTLNHYDLRLQDNGKPVTKQTLWERKLLDFSLRNNLINTRLGKKVIPFISFEIEHLEDHIQNNEDYRVVPSPGTKIDPNTDGLYDSSQQAAGYRNLVAELIDDHQIASYLTEAELQASLKFMHRAARTALEENGANCLFLTLGMLRWFETDKSQQPRYAPLLLLPVDIVRKSANNYVVRKRDEEIILNITLVELLKQNFNINLDSLAVLPKDQSGVDVKLIFTYFRQAIINQKRWNVIEESMLGLFSFNKFVMWNDIHANADKLKQNLIVASLIDGKDHQGAAPETVDARVIDKEYAPKDFAIPLDVDSSQMEAIVESGRGRSFILHGPPGTGKSQTITNMIANALYQGKRVLFVAEKMAALSVVQSRLEKIGLAPYCLELHSNKATKKHFLEQMDQVLKITRTQSPAGYAQKSDELFRERQALISYMEALHRREASGLSLYDSISQYLSLEDDEMSNVRPAAGSITAEYIDNCLALIPELETVLAIIGTPAAHGLYGLEPKDNRQQTLDQLFTLLSDIQKEYAQYGDVMQDKNVAKWQREWTDIQAKWVLPRYFAQKDFMKRLERAGHDFGRDVDGMMDLLSAYEHLQQQVGQLNTLTCCRYELADVTQSADRWLNHELQMRDWYHWVDQKQALLRMGLQPVVSQLEQGAQPQQTVRAYVKAIYHRLIETIIDGNDQLRMFNGLKFRQQIEKYKTDTKVFQQLSKQELLAKLASRLPSQQDESGEISFLKRNIANGGRGNSIRTILDGVPTLLPKLCPCMLMSPISVAQYIDLDADKFDIVIFDEASQMPTSEAVGAIARGKALIVVGDAKQMPPTSFFATTQVDEEEADIDDMESILDDCITLSLSEHQLNWHYRSKHESLIAFSNSQYYGNDLLTFPSTDDRVAKVRLVQVDGVYDKGRSRSNPEESKAIVSEIIRRLSNPELRKFSIGVVSFSKVQGDRIEDDLTEALDKHPDLKEYAYNSDEPIFVKNLENVQGDERDVILFSVGYGADKDGKVSMNFGPLNNNGGERRLNVAVSRARYEMVVYSTLRASQIDLKRSQARGVEGLKGFLEFAETGRLPLLAGTARPAETSVMINQICEALQSKGYIAERAVGRSNFKVDIAVAMPEQPDAYILGILCDGRNYYETKTTRDREIVQPSVLKMLHWHVMRVYSLDWYDNPERTLTQILDELQHALQPEEPEPEPVIPEPEPIVPEPQSIQQPVAPNPWSARQPEAPKSRPVQRPVAKEPEPAFDVPRIPRFCTNCGSLLQPGVRYCNNCGTKIVRPIM